MQFPATAIITLAIVFASATGWAIDTNPRPAPPPDTIDCATEENRDTCSECGSGGIFACCYDEDCEVINKPKKTVRFPFVPLRPPRPVRPILPVYPGAPGGSGSWGLF